MTTGTAGSYPDVTIVGGGAVGLYLAKRFSSSGISTSLIDVVDGDNNLLRQDVASVGQHRHRGVDEGWASGIGGTTELWGGQLWPWEPVEFLASDVDGIRAWPEDVARHVLDSYPTVIEHLGLARAHGEIHAGALRERQDNGGLREGRLRHSSWMNRVERRFAENRSLAAARSAVSLIQMRVDRVDQDRAGWAVMGRGPTGEELLLRSKRIVLAAGTLGTFRILARSRLADPSSLGGGFMDHVSSPVAAFRIAHPSRFRSHAAPLWHRGVLASPRLLLANAPGGRTLPRGYGHWEIGVPEWVPLTIVKNALATRRTAGLGAAVPTVARHLPEVASTLASAAARRHRPVLGSSTVRLRVDVQQGASDHRRLEYDQSADKVLVHWDVSNADRDNIRTVGQALVRDLDLGSVGLDLVDVVETDAQDIFHMMGGASLGGEVVDTRSKVRAADSLYVAGAITFPSGGLANPTMTALALAEVTVEEIVGA